MQLPETFSDDFLGVEAEFSPPDSVANQVVYSMVFPPIGFFPFAATGNGDHHGLYWPIGSEHDEPIVAYSSHDAYAIIPEYSDLERAATCQMATDESGELAYEFKQAIAAVGIESLQHAGPPIESSSHAELHALDKDSPFRNCVMGDLFVAANQFDEAEQHYKKALARVPEYGAAHFGLAFLLRRQRRPEEMSLHLRGALLAPLTFSGSHFWSEHWLPGKFRSDWPKKALLWLQKEKQVDNSLIDDPFVKSISKINLQTGEARSSDIEIWLPMVDDLIRGGRSIDAVYLWIMIGDKAARETTSFRQRYDFTPQSYGERLAELFAVAGLDRREKLTLDMLEKLDKPDGLHL